MYYFHVLSGFLYANERNYMEKEYFMLYNHGI